ncbi:MAG: hypothetical protein JWN78_3069 [Bacteroidota bacterium]|nr:hypothetical protein [Bacteroidota bacterium]
MFCKNCGFQYEIVPIEEGKNKFCKNCGNILYKNINGDLVFNTGIPEKDVNQIEKDQLEKQKIENEIRELKELKEQERIIKERQQQLLRDQEERERKKRLEQERLERKQLEKERAERERIEKLMREQEEKERELRERIEREVRGTLQKEQQEKERQRRELEQREKDRQQQLQLERLESEAQKAKEDSLLAEQHLPEPHEIRQKSGFQKFMLYFALPIIIISSVCILIYFLYPEKVLALFNVHTSIELTDSTNINTTIKNDNQLTEQFKTDLADKEILSWGKVNAYEIISLEILNKSDSAQNTTYTVIANLGDNNGTKAVAELSLKYNNLLLERINTNKITYANTAPVNAWFSFHPVQHCDIFVNTNNSPIRLKGCANCTMVIMNSGKNNPEKLLNHPATIFITSDAKSEAIVDFIYVPEK